MELLKDYGETSSDTDGQNRGTISSPQRQKNQNEEVQSIYDPSTSTNLEKKRNMLLTLLKKKDSKKLSGKCKKSLQHSTLLNECKCPLKCKNEISSDRRNIFNKQYWKSDYLAQKNMIL